MRTMIPATNTVMVLPFLWIIVVVINADTPKIIDMSTSNTNLLRGIPLDFSSPLKFDLLTKNWAIMELLVKDNLPTLSIRFDGSQPVLTYGGLTSKYSESIVSQTHFNSFKVDYRNMSVQIYRVFGNQWKRIMFLENITNWEPQRIRLRAYGSKWIFHYPDTNTENSVWKTSSPLVNRKFLDSVLWVKDAMNLGLCTILCSKDEACMSYNFNPETKKCQGHLGNYYYTTGRTFIEEVNAIHYYKYNN